MHGMTVLDLRPSMHWDHLVTRSKSDKVSFLHPMATKKSRHYKIRMIPHSGNIVGLTVRNNFYMRSVNIIIKAKHYI